MANFKRNVALILLVITLAVSALLLAVSNGFLSTLIDTSVADDCSSPGANCDSHGCRLDRGEMWCDGRGCIPTTGEFAQTCDNPTNPPPGGSTCSTESTTAAACRGKPVNSTQTYGGLTGRCVINRSPHCAFILNATTPAPQPPVTPPAENPSNTGNTCMTGGVCQGYTPGTPLSNYGCTCNSACLCAGNNTQTEGGLCVGDGSCAAGLTCLPINGASRCLPSDTPNVPVNVPPASSETEESLLLKKLITKAADYRAPRGVECGRGKCPSPDDICVETGKGKGYCRPGEREDTTVKLSDKGDNNKYRFAITGESLSFETRAIDLADAGGGGTLLQEACNPEDFGGSTEGNSVVVSELGYCDGGIVDIKQDGTRTSCPVGKQMVKVCRPSLDGQTGERTFVLSEASCVRTTRCSIEQLDKNNSYAPYVSASLGHTCSPRIGEQTPQGTTIPASVCGGVGDTTMYCSYGPRPTIFESSEIGFFCRKSERESCRPEVKNVCGDGLICHQYYGGASGICMKLDQVEEDLLYRESLTSTSTQSSQGNISQPTQ